MSEGDSVSVSQIAVAVILVGMLLSGPVGGVELVGERPSIGDGTASVTVVEPTAETIQVTEGRFGTNVSYVRIPDLVLDVTSVDGQPRVLYQVTIPELGIKKQNDKLVRSTGRLRVPISDHTVPKEKTLDGTTARLVVRVQSYSGGEVVMNRTVEVRRG
ncbi:MAG: hypothetical protein V5A45_08390 [Haloarculaceae archaeon]